MHRSRPPAGWLLERGLRVTHPAWASVWLAAQDDGRAIDEALRRGAVSLDQLEAAYRGAKEAALAAARKAAEVDRLAAEGQDIGIQVNTMAARLGIAYTRVSIRASRHRERLRKALGGRE